MTRTRVPWTECLLVGVLVFGLAGTGGVLLLLAGLVFLIRSEGVSLEDYNPTAVAFAATAATLAGVVAWRRIVATTDSRPGRGAWAGLVVGVAAHPLCWFLLLLVQTARDPALRGQSAYEMAFGVAFMTLWMSISSLGLAGWISAPLGATLGYLARRIRRHHALPPGESRATGE